jgi:nucleotide-binding universal stress UspA family protein
MKTFLVPTDFSPPAYRAFRYACGLAGNMEAKIILFHAYLPAAVEPFTAPAMQRALMSMQEDQAIEEFGKMEREVPEDLREKISLDFRVKLGTVVEEVLYLAEKIRPDLIIMGMRGSSGLARRFMGSKTRGVIQRSQFPVLAIPTEADYRPFKKIAYAATLEEADADGITKALAFAAHFDATLSVVHVRAGTVLEEDARKSALEARFENSISQNRLDFISLSSSEVLDGIENYVSRYEIDLLAMLTGKKTLFDRFFRKSHTKEMAIHTRIPLLTYYK